ncbi:alanine racemase [Ferviditalea candida]|uniref:Alanine racemase n=1 Tax=Ferviditalea candida TaxID=3108399 RepID=A0ABU5ZMN4_9BACL|nr:alanine racemase [Paenibacillaceae bacterium T2]
MDSFYRPTWVEISLDALRSNVAAFRSVLPQAMKLMAVVKADAYGHGAREVAQEALACGADYLGVAFLDEALELRAAGITASILVLGYTPVAGILTAYANDITLTVYSDEVLEALAGLHREYASFGRPMKIHVKIDTGMGRIGLHDQEGAVRFIERAIRLEGVSVEGLFTHYARADEEDKAYTFEQHRRFEAIVEHFRSKGVVFPILHAGNSATGIEFPELSYNMLRLGISLYGLYPSEEVNRRKVELLPVMSFKTKPVMIKTLPPGSGISYGTIYTTSGEETIATLPVGYADGYTRMLTSKAEVLVRGHRVPVVGKICMDQCMINVTDVPELRLDDEVVLFGRQGSEVVSADDLAAALGTINYEITCMVSNRVPRVYIRNGQPYKVVNRLL